MIEINNLTTAVVDEDFLKKTAKIVIDGESSFAPAFAKASAFGRRSGLRPTKSAGKKASKDKERKIDLSIALVGQERIKKLNKKYRRKNRPTDVLSFFYDDSGEIVICLSEVKKNAEKFKSVTERSEVKKRTSFSSPFEKELAKVLIHGALHLLGYDHEKGEKEARKMEEKQKYYLKKFF